MKNKKRNIALVSPSKNAYSETFIQMHKIGIEGNVTYFYNDKIPTKNDKEGGIITRKIKLTYFIKRQLKKPQLSLKEYAFYKSLRSNKIELVVAEYGTTAASILKICKLLNLPLIPIFHGFDASIHSILESHREKYKELFNYSFKIVVVSNTLKQKLIELSCPKEKLVLNPCAPNDTFFSLSPEFKEPKFIAIGRFVDKKAPYYTILAFLKVLSKHPTAELYLIGNGPLFNMCKNLVNYYHINKNIHFLGVLNPSEICKYLENSLAFVQHSVTALNGDSEGTPVSILEASAASLPVISTKHSGIVDAVKNEITGFLVDEHDVDSMSDKMCRLIEDKSLARKLGKEGKLFMMKEYSKKKHLKLLNDVIYKAL